MKKVRVRARVDEDGRLLMRPDQRRIYELAIGAHAGHEVSLTVARWRDQRSSPQNRYYHGVVVAMLAEFCGYDRDDMHEALAMKFLRIEDCPVTGVPRRRRTPDCDTKDFADYVDACVRLAAESGVVIPDPNQVEA